MGSGVSTAQETEAKELIATLRSSNDSSARINALQKLYDALNTEQNKALLASPSLGLIPELINILRNKSGDELKKAISCTFRLSLHDDNKPTMTTRQMGLLPLLVKNIPINDDCFIMMSNMTLRPDNHDYMLSQELGLAKYNRDKLEETGDEKYLKFYSNVSAGLRASNLDLFMSYNPVEAMVKRMFSCSVEELKKGNGPGYWVLNFINRMSYHPTAAARMKEMGIIPRMTELMAFPIIAGLKATIAMFNMVGKEEANQQSQSLIQSKPEMFNLLLQVFKATLMKDVGPEGEACKKVPGYLFGMIKMRNICGAIRTLSISDTNKPLLLKTNVLDLLIRTLRLFTENALQLNILVNNMAQTGGGGGDDDETCSMAIEALLQLSFNYEMDERLREVYTHACEYDVIQILTECVADRRNKLSGETKRNAANLLKRLKMEAAVAAPSSGTAAGHHSQHTKHIMLSYSWAVNKHLVVRVGQRLRELGHEVWRDEEGSSLVGPMQGDTDEKMAAAIEAAHTVVIFVSPQYKESGNCRMEAKYSKQRQLACPLKILYVMMCENYHTRSNPPVDGWLALNIGTDLWYPLWHESMVNSTAQAISDLAGPPAVSGGGGGSLHVSQPGPSSPVRAASVQSVSSPASGGASVDLDAAWSFLRDPAASSNSPEDLSALIDSLGLEEKGDLKMLKDDELRSIGALMKTIKQRKFLAAMGLSD